MVCWEALMGMNQKMALKASDPNRKSPRMVLGVLNVQTPTRRYPGGRHRMARLAGRTIQAAIDTHHP